MKLGNKNMPKVETVLDDDDGTVAYTYFQDGTADKTTMPEQDIIDDDGKPIDGLDHIVDSCINMEVRFPSLEKELYKQVVGLGLDKSRRMIGIPHNNPYMNTVLYKIKFNNGASKAYGANIIAANIC